MSSLPISKHNDNSTDTPSLSLTSNEQPHAAIAPVIDESHYEQLEQLVRRAKPARKAASYAGFSGWMTLLAGVIQLPFAFGNPAMLLLCVVLAGIGTRELTLRRKLLKLEMSAPQEARVQPDRAWHHAGELRDLQTHAAIGSIDAHKLARFRPDAQGNTRGRRDARQHGPA